MTSHRGEGPEVLLARCGMGEYLGLGAPRVTGQGPHWLRKCLQMYWHRPLIHSEISRLYDILILTDPVLLLQDLVLILSSIWIAHQILQLLYIGHPRWPWHVLQVVSNRGPVPPQFVLVQCIHNPWCVNVRSDLDHLFGPGMPASNPDIDNVKCFPYDFVRSRSMQYNRRNFPSSASELYPLFFPIRDLLTRIHHALEIDLLHRPPTITSPMNGLWMNFEFIGMVHKHHAHPAQGIDIKVH